MILIKKIGNVVAHGLLCAKYVVCAFYVSLMGSTRALPIIKSPGILSSRSVPFSDRKFVILLTVVRPRGAGVVRRSRVFTYTCGYVNTREGVPYKWHGVWEFCC